MEKFEQNGEIELTKWIILPRNQCRYDQQHTDLFRNIGEFSVYLKSSSLLDFWDERARGLGATTWVPVRAIKKSDFALGFLFSSSSAQDFEPASSQSLELFFSSFSSPRLGAVQRKTFSASRRIGAGFCL